ncbi:pyrimidine/purine nucleoside phosphorylase [Acinetobacter sp. c2-A9]|uniref:pyrimidine/purine nucleoside phosphorylase n=1 Tax=Acinetobacter sp. c2-A9 TaxID=3342802 RepID=UPI0035BB08BE
MNLEQFDRVSVVKKSNVYFDGKCVSHTVHFEDGSKKTLGVLLPIAEGLVFKTHVPERMEIVSGKCRVIIADETEANVYSQGQSFFVAGNSFFSMQALEVVDYVCHLEG